uniref:Ig-like domain-containing protein n=1 Tax=Oryzias latipes TaxID=8090 RepID=H2LQZ7_ORYLA
MHGLRLLHDGDPSDPLLGAPLQSVPAPATALPSGSSSLLCLASAMFPPVVQFFWKRQKNNGTLEKLTSEEQLDLRESGRSASILLVHHQEDSSYKYICSVKHEGGTVEAQTQQGNEGAPVTCVSLVCWFDTERVHRAQYFLLTTFILDYELHMMDRIICVICGNEVE